MAASSERRTRRGPAPIASFDHDVSEESSPETKQALRLPEIREDLAASSEQLAPPEQRARSHSSPAVHATPASAPAPASLHTPAAPRIDISRASSSSHHDSRDSSPELALFAGADDSKARLELGFREDGALDLRSSTEELAFLEGAPGGADPPRAPSVGPSSRRHSRKDSQGSEAALLGVAGRQSRLSSVGSQCSAQSALSGFSHASRMSVGRLSVVSGVSRSPSPHKMLLETSFCGPKPIETDPDVCVAAVERRMLEIAKMSTETSTASTTTVPAVVAAVASAVDARDRREVRTEATVENARPAASSRASPGQQQLPVTAPTAAVTSPAIVPFDEDKLLKETRNRAKVEERRTRPKVRRQPSEPEVFKSVNRSKNVIRIKLKPDDEYEDDDDGSERTLVGEAEEAARKPATLELRDAPRPDALGPQLAPPRPSRTPSPPGAAVSRKSSFCSLFKSRETIASPDSTSDVLRRKKSLNEGRSRSKSGDRSTTPTSAAKIKGSVLSLFKTPRWSTASPSPGSRDASPVVQQHRQFPQTPPDRSRERLKYYEDTRDGVIHIPLRTPPDEPGPAQPARPASAPQPRAAAERPADVGPAKPSRRTVLPDGSIIIPLHSPTESTPSRAACPESPVTAATTSPAGDANSSIYSSTSRNVDTTHRVSSLGVSSGEDERASIQSPGCQPAEPGPGAEAPGRARRKERLIFTTHVGSRDEQVFCTQFSITKTPSVTSEISESAPSFPDCEERPRAPSPPEAEGGAESEGERTERGASPAESSGSEAGSCGSAAERRGLVVQESFEELPYVPTTLPLERSLALPMVPVRDRPAAAPPPAAVRRPRARAAPAAPLPAPAAPPAAPPPPPPLRIRLPQRTRASSTGGAAPQRPARPRSRSGGDNVEVRKEWIDFSELPEQRKQPKRIETVGGAGAGAAAGAGAVGAGVVFSYVPPERCRCECHAHDDERPLLHDDKRNSSSSPECSESGHDAPFTADLDLRHTHTDMAPPAPH